MAELGEDSLSTIRKASVGWVEGWGLGLSDDSLIHVPGDWCWLAAGSLTEAIGQDTSMCPLGVAWASLQHGSWVLRVGFPKARKTAWVQGEGK